MTLLHIYFPGVYYAFIASHSITINVSIFLAQKKLPIKNNILSYEKVIMTCH